MSRILYTILGVLLILGATVFVAQPEKPLQPIPMPLYQGDLKFPVEHSGIPEPHRDESVKKWLIPSVRIRVPGAAGSGTICYYDRSKNLAYVISCAHLFTNGTNGTYVEVFYKNEKKLDTPQKFQANVISYKKSFFADDISFMTFEPDWVPQTWFPIAPVDHPINNGTVYNSCGCDAASEVACYFVKPQGIDGSFLATIENSPRPGRSGGGLMDKDGLYVGICVRTSVVDGSGTGYFVHLKTIHDYCKDNNLSFLLNIKKPNDLLKTIPIVDRNGPQGNYPPDYIPVP